MNLAPHFAQTYSEAREKFLAAARACGARIFRRVHPSERGAEDEELSLDLAQLGDEHAPGLLLVSSGTHGVEGFCGSGCQVALLHEPAFLAALAQSRVRLLMLHAINPYGFSHLRRANEDNVDLNRNFVDFSAPLPVNREYAEIHSLLLPAAWPPAPENEAELLARVARDGLQAFQAAVTGGQYAFADGMFYGGKLPTWSNASLRAALRGQAAACTRLGWIDLHTGLGPRGHGEKIWAGGDEAGAVARARAWWGPEVTSAFEGTATAARVSGVIANAAATECPRAELTPMVLEYGTYSLEHTLQVLRAEHWLQQHPEVPEAQRAAIKRALRDAFYIDADDWKTMVVAQAKDACLQALAALASPAAALEPNRATLGEQQP
jgi:hypothetical protein